ncbi:unnamed protein product, partial [marine sediment metagenome]
MPITLHEGLNPLDASLIPVYVLPSRYEHYATRDDYSYAFHSSIWQAQTFIPATTHKITSVKLKLWKEGSPGTVTISIRATDGRGHPTGGDLCSGTINGNTISGESPGAWYEITLGAGYTLNASTKYAIVARSEGKDLYNSAKWRCDITSPTYFKGNKERSTNSGVSWTSLTS